MNGFLRNLFRKTGKSTEPLQEQEKKERPPNDDGYLGYCIELEQALRDLETYLLTCDDPKEIAMQALKTACTFYGGDWAGTLEIDLDFDIWAPVWWYILTEMLNSLQAIRNRRMLWSLDVIELNKQISELTSQNQMLATLKQQGLIDSDIFISQNNELTEQLRTAKLKKERLLVADGDSTITQTRELMEVLDAGPDFLDCFDAELFGELVEKIIVDSNVQLRFRLKNGLELVEAIERAVR